MHCEAGEMNQSGIFATSFIALYHPFHLLYLLIHPPSMLLSTFQEGDKQAGDDLRSELAEFVCFASRANSLVVGTQKP